MKRNIKINLIWGAVIVLGYGLLLGLIQANLLDGVGQTVIMGIGISLLMAVSLNLIIGTTGQFTLGHAGFMSIGAYCAGVSVKLWGSNLSSFFIGLAIGLVITTLVALLIALPTLRLKGDYLAIATLGFGEIIRIVIQNMEITNGAAGLVLPKLIDWQLIYVVVVLGCLVVFNFVNSRYGRACKAVREDELASETLGVNTTQVKVLAFVLAALLASIAGWLYAGSFYVIKPDMFTFNKSLEILVIVIFGGMGSYTGTILAAFIISLFNQVLQSFSDVRMIIYGALLVVMMIFRPQGMMGNYEISLRRKLEEKR